MANKYKKFVATAATATLVASAIVPVASANEVKFSDVKDSSEYAKYINDLSAKQVMTGNGDKFNPGVEVTRTAAVKTVGKWLVNVHGFEVPADWNTKARFNDVTVDSKDEELVKYAALLKDLGIFTGNEAGNLNAKNTLNREQMAKVVVEAYSVIEGVEVVDLVADFESSLKDLDSVSPGNVNYVKVFEKYGITTVDTFNPKGKMQRQHFAKFLSISINSEALAADTAVLAKDVTAALNAVSKAVAALPKVEEVTAETAEAATKAVEAVTKAVEAATKVIATAELTADEKTAADKKLADATAAAKLVADKVAEVTNIVEIASVKGINETSFEITLPKAFTTKEADLVGKQITVVAGEKSLVATYSEKSLDKDGKAIFTLASGVKFEDAVKYTAKADWAKFTADTFVAKTAPAQVATFEKVTTAVPATKDAQGNALVTETKIQISAKDQYGEDFSLATTTLDVTGTLNGMPLAASEISGAAGVITVTPELKAGDVLAFTVSTKDANGKVIAKNEFTYEIVKGEAAKIAKIELAAKDNKVELKEGSTIEVTAKAFNQFNSVETVDANNVAWFVNGEAAAAGTVTNGVLTLASKPSGEYKIQAFSKADSKIKAEITVTIGAAELTDLTYNAAAFKDVTGTAVTLKDKDNKEVVATADNKFFNKEELLLGTLSVNPGAKVSAADVKFNVVAPKGLAKEDIKVVAEEVTTEDGKKVILVKATTTKAGEFKVTPFIGASFTAEDVEKASEIEIETTVNPEIASIEVGEVAAKELKVGANPITEVVIKNKHGEVLTATEANATLTVKTTDEAVAKGKVRQGIEANKGEDKNKTYLELFTNSTDGLAKGTAVLTVQAGTVVKALQVTTTEAELKTIKVKDAKLTGVIAGDADAKYNEISFLDQDGVDMTAAPTLTITDATGKAATGLTVVLGEKVVNEKTGDVTFKTNGKKSHLQVTAADTLAQGTYTVTATVAKTVDGKEVKVATSFQVVVDGVRVPNTVTISAVEENVVAGATATVKVMPKDQYGEVLQSNAKLEVKLNDTTTLATTAVTAADLDTKLAGTAAGAKVVYYTAETTALAKGDNKVTAVIVDKDNKKVASASQVLKVDTTAALVNTVEITEVKGAQNVNATDVELEAIVKDASGKAVSVEDSKLAWSIAGVKDAKGKELKVEAGDAAGEFKVTLLNEKGEAGDVVVLTLADGKLGTKTAGSLKDLTVDVKVSVETENFKSATTTVTIGDAAAKYVSGLKVAKVFNGVDATADEVKFTGNGTELVIDDASKAITLTFTGVDQYGAEFVDFSDLTTANTTAVAADLATSVKTVDGVTYLTFTAVSVEGGEIYLNYKGEKVTFKVTVAGDAKEAIEAASN